MSETLSERMLRWPENEDIRDTTLVGISPATVRDWIERVIAIEIERVALRHQVESLLAEAQNESEQSTPGLLPF